MTNVTKGVAKQKLVAFTGKAIAEINEAVLASYFTMSTNASGDDEYTALPNAFDAPNTNGSIGGIIPFTALRTQGVGSNVNHKTAIIRIYGECNEANAIKFYKWLKDQIANGLVKHGKVKANVQYKKRNETTGVIEPVVQIVDGKPVNIMQNVLELVFADGNTISMKIAKKAVNPSDSDYQKHHALIVEGATVATSWATQMGEPSIIFNVDTKATDAYCSFVF